MARVKVTAMFVVVVVAVTAMFVVVFVTSVVTTVVWVVVVTAMFVVGVVVVVTKVVVFAVGLVSRPFQLGNIVSLFVFRVPLDFRFSSFRFSARTASRSVSFTP